MKIVIVACLSGFLICSCSHRTGGSAVVNYYTDSNSQNRVRITYGDVRPAGIGWASAHAAIIAWIKVHGKKYDDLYGDAPYFQLIEGLQKIAIFQNVKNNEQLVLIDLRDGSRTDITGDWTGYGFRFARKDPTSRDFVKLSDDKKFLYVTSVTLMRTYKAKVSLTELRKVSEQKIK